MADGFDGTVDAATERRARAASAQEMFLGQAWSAGASPEVQAAMMRSASTRGAEAAKNIRNRYFKKEWEQISQVEIQPHLDKLKAAEEARKLNLQATTMPVKSVVTPEQFREKLQADAAAGPPKLQTMPVQNKDGSKGQEMVPVPNEAPPNPALDKVIGALETEETLAFTDPVSGEPIPVSSDRGVAIMKNANSDFWATYGQTMKDLMNIGAKYTGNPYVSNFMDNMVSQVGKTAGLSATGQADPQKAQEWVENRKDWEAQNELKKQEVATGNSQAKNRDAQLEVMVNDAQRLAETDPAFKDVIGKTIVNKFANGTPLTDNEKWQALNASKLHRSLQEKKIIQKAREGVFTIPSTMVKTPKAWLPFLVGGKDATFNNYRKQEYNKLVSASIPSLRSQANENPEAFSKRMRTRGVEEADIQLFLAGAEVPTSIMDAVKSDLSGDVAQKSYERAYLRRLPELESSGQQPELTTQIDQSIEEAIQALKVEAAERGEVLLPEMIDVIRADRYRTFFKWTTGKPAPKYYDPATEERLMPLIKAESSAMTKFKQDASMQAALDYEAAVAEARKAGVSILPESTGATGEWGGSTGEWGTTTPSGPLSPKSKGIYGPGASIYGNPPKEIQAPASASPTPSNKSFGTIGAHAAERQRVYGPSGGPISMTGSALRKWAESRGASFEPRTVASGRAYNAQGQLLGPEGQPLTAPNVFMSLDLPVLTQMLAGTPKNSDTYKQLQEAIASKRETASTE